MDSCIVLSDSAVHELLINLSSEEAHGFLGEIETCLSKFSKGGERAHQPEPAVIKRDGRKNLFRMFTSSSGVGVKIIVDPSQALATRFQQRNLSEEERAEKNRLMGLHGILALCDENGFPTGFINAEEITGYRTAMSAMILFVRRSNVGNIVIYGAGKQALWHSRLALALRGSDVQRISIINRSNERTNDLIKQVQQENEVIWKVKNVEFHSIASADEDKIKEVLKHANVVFCTTPSKAILFPADFLLKERQDCYVSAIGSWSSDMIELDPELLKYAVSKGQENGIVVVDDQDSCMSDTGELIQSGLSKTQVVEVGEILYGLSKNDSEVTPQRSDCMKNGLVVYKSVGVSLTDFAAGQAVLKLASKRKVGLAVSEF